MENEETKKKDIVISNVLQTFDQIKALLLSKERVDFEQLKKEILVIIDQETMDIKNVLQKDSEE